MLASVGYTVVFEDETTGDQISAFLKSVSTGNGRYPKIYYHSKTLTYYSLSDCINIVSTDQLNCIEIEMPEDMLPKIINEDDNQGLIKHVGNDMG